VNEAQLRMLLRLLQLQRNGWFGFHFGHGRVRECDLRMTFPGRDYEVERVSDGIAGKDDVR
jgi:hypothetical protein